MKENILKLRNCYGCGVCVNVCPVKIISLRENPDGFYQPAIEKQDKCIECGRCLKTCAFNHTDVAQEEHKIESYGAWSNNENVRLRCSSGGIGFEIGRKLIENGYKGIGVLYNPDTYRAEHFIANTVEEFMPSAGSKYIPSDMTKALTNIDSVNKYLVTGTPCQIDSFRRYIRMIRKEENFILLDFFCHGVPSLLLWDKYISELSKQIGEPTFVSWRNKTTGWHDSWSMQADINLQSLNYQVSYNLNKPEKKHLYTSRKSEGDLFYKMFLDNLCLNKCCYTTCKYKLMASAADIRIGDAWGTTYKENTKGVSILLALTTRGKNIVSSLEESSILEPKPLSILIEGQMQHNAHYPSIRDKVINALKTDMTLNQIDNNIIKPYYYRFIPARIANRILRTLRIKPIFRTR